MKKIKAHYTVFYEIDNAKTQIKSKPTTKAPDEVFWHFHLFMQNNSDIERERYSVSEVHRGNIKKGLIRYDEFNGAKTPIVLRSSGKTNLFKK